MARTGSGRYPVAAVFPNLSLTITVHEEDGEDWTDSACAFLSPTFAPKRPQRRILGRFRKLRANGPNGKMRQGPAASHARNLKDSLYGKPPSRRAGRSIVGLGAVLAGRLGRQAGHDRPALRLDLDLGDRRRQADRLCPHAQRAQPLRADLLVGAVAGRALPHALRPQDERHGRDLRRRDARVEEELREGREVAARAADPHRQGDGSGADARDGTARRQARLPRHDRLGRALHRPVRHGGRHHDLVPGDRRLEVDQPRRRGARHRRGAARHRDRPARRHPGGHRLQQAVIGRRQDRGAHGGVRRRVLRHTLAPNR